EIHHFFDNTPLDSVAYIVIQHLSPDFTSRMAQLLDKHSKLKVKEAEENILVEKNFVYLIPNKKIMTIEKGRLQLTEKEKIKKPHFTINTFFESLAYDQGEKTIGIILSGMGSDGTEGVKAIKDAGGMIIARDPKNTPFASMPASAIAAGVVDFILEPEEMPHTIFDYINNVFSLNEPAIETREDEKSMRDILQLIKAQHPLDFSDYKPTTILRRIVRRAAFHHLEKLPEYLNFLKTSPEEVDALAKEFLISVSSFFRDAEAFEFLEKEIIPKIIEEATTGDEIKLWVAGCATGEEAYSLAILLTEQLNNTSKSLTIKIFATDVDNDALLFASKGIYSESILKDVSEKRLEKHFIMEDGSYKIKPNLRKMLIFAHHDLIKNPPYGNMTLISCRNVLIYMNPVLQNKIYKVLLYGLKRDGYLFLGPSENPFSIIDSLDTLDRRCKIYRAKKEKQAIRLETILHPTPGRINPITPQMSLPKIESKKNVAGDALIQSLFEELNYSMVCVNDRNEVVQTFGDTTKFLLQKNFTSALGELLPKPLAVAYASASKKALQSNEKILVKGIFVEDRRLAVNLLVKPLEIKKFNQKILLVALSDDDTTNTLQQPGEVFDKKIYFDEYVLNMEEELRELKEELRLTYEKLETSDENLHAYNEELLSANEEMQSTNEEMQSINEELHTMNADYQMKNKELAEINDDLNNYFRSNINGQLFVNRDVLLMK
ncbi:MAG TPA: CheR family methyltransferase, partial [Segetibacter sp.]